MRYLAIDLGDKRTGLATGDDVTRMVSPITVLDIPRGERLIDVIQRAIDEHEPHALILGLPLNMDGTEGDRAKIVREFGNQLAAATNLPVRYQDERLTSEAANKAMARTGRTHRQKKKLRDALAAAVILQQYIDEHAT